MRIFRDSAAPEEIPLDGCQGVLLYANGDYAATAEEEVRFLAAGLEVAHIDVLGTAWDAAAILDVETGDATAAGAPAWVVQRFDFRQDAAVYCSLDNTGELFAAMAVVTVPWRLLVADWTGARHVPALPGLPANAVILGCQYLAADGYDESVIIDEGWHRP